jgi:hypothetical protein
MPVLVGEEDGGEAAAASPSMIRTGADIDLSEIAGSSPEMT